MLLNQARGLRLARTPLQNLFASYKPCNLLPSAWPGRAGGPGPTAGYSRLVAPMAHSKWEYVKSYEQDDRLLPGCFIVVRVDGKGFTR